jgi:hypothetical protein
MEDMDLVVAPPLLRVIVNPLHPDYAEGPAKGARGEALSAGPPGTRPLTSGRGCGG